MQQDRGRHASTWMRLLAVLMAVTFVAAACGSSDDGGDGEATSEADEQVAVDEADAEADADVEADAEADTDAADEDADMASVDPVMGGTLTYLVEAETDTWDIPGANCAVSCITIMRAVADPLTIINSDGEVEPFVLESIESNADFTMFTMTMRDGILFHDGTPADGAALQRSLQEMASGLLQGQVLVDLVEGPDSVVLVDPMTVTVEFAKPYSTFPRVVAERTGWLIAPAFWDDPDRAGALMIGTGAFRMAEWTRGEQTVLERNPDYWRTDANGTQLPYLDSVVFRPVPDVSTRRATMEAGDADVNMDSFGENKAFWNGEWLDDGGNLLVPALPRETTYLLINNGAPPFDDPDLRRAVALCTDRDEYLEFRAPANQKANGPFAEGALGFLEDTGFPEFDPEAGNALLDEIGRPELITYGTTNVPSNLLTAELFVDMWTTNCGLNVQIDQFDQSELITKAITGQFEVFLWRNHGQGNPGLEEIWWHSRHAEGLALNFGRIIEPDLDTLLDATWTTDDAAELDALGQDINRLFAENVNNLWLNFTEWANPYQGNVHGVGVLTLPSGNFAQTGLAGRTWVEEAWIEG